MATRYNKTLADYVVIAISPALIMTLVGSLVFFLLEIFYQGNFTGRLHYILTLFIFAAVLIGRISIEDSKERAALFAVPLAIATLLAITRFVQFQGVLGQASLIINCGLVGLIWWCAHKLTWDCTMIDETEPGSGEGLLDAAGLGQTEARSASEVAPTETATRSASEEAPGRWNAWRSPRGKPHAPGVWVVYFSLAALPLFGLGQLAIPVAQTGQRRYAFGLLAVYVASGLGLLLTTSFLGLRRYLRQRRLPMPMLMAGTWIALGCMLIFAVMGLALLLPRPNAEFAASQIPFVMGSPDQKPSKHGVGNDGVEGSEPGRPEPDAKDKPPAARDDNDSKGGQSSNKPGSEKADEPPAADENARPQSVDSSNQRSADDKSKRDSPPRQPFNRQKPNERSQDPRSGGEKSKPGTPSKEGAKTGPARPASEPPPPIFTPPMDISSALVWLLPLLQVLFYAVLVGLAAFWAWRHRAGILAALGDLLSGLRSLWERLLGSRKKTAEAATKGEAASPRPRRFADFADPFATGMAERLAADQLVRYLFEALEAWACENGCARGPEQTPLEFARRAGQHTLPLGQLAVCLADLYCEAAYAPGRLRISNIQPLQELWRVLRTQSNQSQQDLPGLQPISESSSTL